MDMTLSRRALLAWTAAGVVIPQALWAADTWPTKTVRIIVPFAPGGGADYSARILANLFAPELGQAVIVENQPGAASAIGVRAAAQSKDGHTLLMASNSMVINPSLHPHIGYDPVRDFDAVGMVSAQPLVLVVPASSSVKSIQDLITLAKAQPGLSAGNSGIGTLAHIASEIFASQVDIQITPVAYKGESELLPDMIAGRVAFGFLNLPSVVRQIKAGLLRALAVSSPHPVAELPGVPTLRSLSYPALEVQGWAALLAPNGTIPAEGLDRLAKLLKAALESDTVKTHFAALGIEPFVMDRQATGQFLQAEASRYARVIKARGIKAG